MRAHGYQETRTTIGHINKIWYTHIMKYYTAMAANELKPWTRKWMNFTMLNKRSQMQKNTYCVSLCIQSPKVGKIKL